MTSDYEPVLIPIVNGRYVTPPPPEIDHEAAEEWIAQIREGVKRHLADGAPDSAPEEIAMLREGIEYSAMLDVGLGEDFPADLKTWSADPTAPTEHQPERNDHG